MRRKLAKNPPPLIQIAVANPELLGKSLLDPSKSRVTSIEQSFKCFEKRYLLATVILHNGSHYCCINLVGGKYLLYNGMFGGEKLKWWNESDLLGAKLNGYYVSHLWYAMEWTDDCKSNSNSDSGDDSVVSDMDKNPPAKK
mmetsp:Transcript_11156/g.23194  ORF Transcript_11156/g.23194 Transcript_11156/m.23194 type:complete len:141 (+) Transcript_11156:892-1314(+)